MQQPLTSLAEAVKQRLESCGRRIVFAESCTAGLISATLARVPGVSNWLCGSSVVYRLDTKTRWLGVPESMLIDLGPVSEPVARLMAVGVLQRTPEASISASITGHLGPGAPPEQDGLIYVGIAQHGGDCQVFEHRLPVFDLSLVPLPFPGTSNRELRQWAAVEFVFNQVLALIKA